MSAIAISGLILCPVLMLLGIFIFSFLTSLPKNHSWFLSPSYESGFVIGWFSASVLLIAWYVVIPIVLIVGGAIYLGCYLGKRCGNYDLVKQEESHEDS